LKPRETQAINEILDQVRYEDEHTDHSGLHLTEDEKLEVALFHSMKQDPFYKHYLRTFLS